MDRYPMFAQYVLQQSQLKGVMGHALQVLGSQLKSMDQKQHHSCLHVADRVRP